MPRGIPKDGRKRRYRRGRIVKPSEIPKSHANKGHLEVKYIKDVTMGELAALSATDAVVITFK